MCTVSSPAVAYPLTVNSGSTAGRASSCPYGCCCGFFGDCFSIGSTRPIKPLRKIEWVVYAKRPFSGPEAVLAYLSRYTHRVAIANSRLLKFNDQGVTFKWKDYRSKQRFRHKSMTLTTDEFIRCFLIHVLPGGFHRFATMDYSPTHDDATTSNGRVNSCWRKLMTAMPSKIVS